MPVGVRGRTDARRRARTDGCPDPGRALRPYAPMTTGRAGTRGADGTPGTDHAATPLNDGRDETSPQRSPAPGQSPRGAASLHGRTPGRYAAIGDGTHNPRWPTPIVGGGRAAARGRSRRGAAAGPVDGPRRAAERTGSTAHPGGYVPCGAGGRTAADSGIPTAARPAAPASEDRTPGHYVRLPRARTATLHQASDHRVRPDPRTPSAPPRDATGRTVCGRSVSTAWLP
jgi:hypothetical protein